MKLGTKKTKQAELLDALGGDVLAASAGVGDLSGPPTPVHTEAQSPVQKDNGRGSLPEVEQERYVSLPVSLFSILIQLIVSVSILSSKNKYRFHFCGTAVCSPWNSGVT